MTGNMLHDRQNPAREKPFRRGPSEYGNRLGIMSIGAISDHLVRTLYRDVENRQAVRTDAELLEIKGMEPRHDERRTAPGLGLAAIDRADFRSGRIIGRQWRSQPLDATAFLIDEDRRVGPPHAITKRRAEIGDLTGIADIPRKQDEPPRRLMAKEAFLLDRQFPAGAAGDHRA